VKNLGFYSSRQVPKNNGVVSEGLPENASQCESNEFEFMACTQGLYSTRGHVFMLLFEEHMLYSLSDCEFVIVFL